MTRVLVCNDGLLSKVFENLFYAEPEIPINRSFQTRANDSSILLKNETDTSTTKLPIEELVNLNLSHGGFRPISATISVDQKFN